MENYTQSEKPNNCCLSSTIDSKANDMSCVFRSRRIATGAGETTSFHYPSIARPKSRLTRSFHLVHPCFVFCSNQNGPCQSSRKKKEESNADAFDIDSHIRWNVRMLTSTILTTNTSHTSSDFLASVTHPRREGGGRSHCCNFHLEI